MKNLKVLFFALIVCSCTAPDLNLGLIEPEPPELIKTTIVGNVSDVERNIPHENLEFIVYRSYENPSAWGGTGWNFEFIASTKTDENGNYSLTFDWIEGESYVIELVTEYPYFNEIIASTGLEAGNINVINFNVWFPTILKLNLIIKNNDYPNLEIYSSTGGGSVTIGSQNLKTTAYLKSRPNFNEELRFTYRTGTSNEDFHHHYEELETNLQDTVTLTYIIDCSSF